MYFAAFIVSSFKHFNILAFNRIFSFSEWLQLLRILSWFQLLSFQSGTGYAASRMEGSKCLQAPSACFGLSDVGKYFSRASRSGLWQCWDVWTAWISPWPVTAFPYFPITACDPAKQYQGCIVFLASPMHGAVPIVKHWIIHRCSTTCIALILLHVRNRPEKLQSKQPVWHVLSQGRTGEKKELVYII